MRRVAHAWCLILVLIPLVMTACSEDDDSDNSPASPQAFNLTVTRGGPGNGTVASTPTGIACGTDCSEPYNKNTVVTLTATPPAGSSFTGWSGEGCSGTGSCTVSMTQARTVTATFSLSPQPQTVTLTMSKVGPGNGTVTSTPAGITCGSTCSAAFGQGTSVTLTASAAAGSSFAGWRGDPDCSDSQVTMNTDKTCMPTFVVAVGPSMVTTNGRQLIVRRRNQDGTLAPATPYIMRGVDWSPASPETQTSPTDANNANVRRPEFGKWATTDIPLMAVMQANTVRLFIDPGFDQTLGPMGLAILDELYREGIMVIMTVDDAINDLNRVRQAVTFYKDHPAILLWMLGSEWNLNRYFGVASSVQDAARRTEVAAALVKTLDPNHPVATSYGEIDINADGLRLADTQNYVKNICPSVDVWGLNIYRGRTFGTLFTEWAALTTKPLFLGEFGTDAFRTTNPTSPPQGAVDEAMQAQWDLSLWNDLFRNLSANDASKVALGGAVFAWNDEWWKVAPAGSQQPGGFVLPTGHPDGFANEEYFGIVTIDRKTRQVYDTFKAAFDPAFTPPPPTIALQAVSRGSLVPGSSLGFGEFRQDGTPFYHRDGGAGGGRGFNVAAIAPGTGALLQPVQNFDTWGTRTTGTAMNAMITFLNGLPNGTVVLVAVGDEAGLNTDNSCAHLSFPWVEAGLRAFEALGSTQLRNYCFRYSWALEHFHNLHTVLWPGMV